ncbi:MAG TPA: DEAD/DEAH box helicase, partial [Thermoanaerobaculia bacterium]|nr:DEAD/DEAH box helicase [Thermoanaerobaculia bacterium]
AARAFAGEVELIVPAALIAQWRETLDAFDVTARILTHDAIVGEPFVPRAVARLVIVDEAHAFRNPRTQRYDALARRSIGARMLLVTATPVCNAIGDLRALVDLLARDDLLADRGVPSIDVAFETRDFAAIDTIVSALVIRRDRSVLGPELQFGELDRHVIRHPVFPARGIDELRFPLVGECAILRRFLWRRIESSEAALLESLRRQLRFYERVLTSGRALPKREYRRAFAHEEDRDAFQQVLFWDLFVPAAESIDPALIREEVARIESLRDAVSRSSCDKRRMLLETLGGEPTLIFTGSAATARDLAAHIANAGLVTSRERSRDAVLRAFRDGKLDVVVSTDMAAEGLNLQRAGVVVHYDIPWNPVKLDQRNGRAHRIGQTRASVRAIYFLPETRGVERIVAAKNRVRRRVVGAACSSPNPEIGRPRAAPTIRPRVARDAAVVRFLAVVERFGIEVPASLERRHKIGVERLLAEMSREFLDERRVAELLALID